MPKFLQSKISRHSSFKEFSKKTLRSAYMKQHAGIKTFPQNAVTTQAANLIYSSIFFTKRRQRGTKSFRANIETLTCCKRFCVKSDLLLAISFSLHVIIPLRLLYNAPAQLSQVSCTEFTDLLVNTDRFTPRLKNVSHVKRI